MSERFDNPITRVVDAAVSKATGGVPVASARGRRTGGSGGVGVPGDGGGLTNPDGSQVLVWGVDAWGDPNTWGKAE